MRGLLGRGAVLGQLWGMTEGTCIIAFVPPGTDIGESSYDVTGSCGWMTPGLELKVANADGRQAADGEQGELCIRGPTVTRGYFGVQTANEETFTPDGFLRSGDPGYQDRKTGLLYIVGRWKELIKVRGFQVSPSEIEDVLRSLASVSDVAVVGVAVVGTDAGEAPMAFVVRSADETGRMLGKDDVAKFVKERLASYKALNGGVNFIDAIPRTASGKISRRVLVERDREGRLNEQAISKL